MSLTFSNHCLPEIVFARGSIDDLSGQLIPPVLLVGAEDDSLMGEITESLDQAGVLFDVAEVSSDWSVRDYGCVVSLGGGFVIDRVKVLSGNCPHIAVVTTLAAGAPMNGVILEQNKQGLRLRTGLNAPTTVIADGTCIDELTRSDFACRAIGIFMMLVESYTSPHISPVSEAMIWSGLEYFASGFLPGLDGDEEGRDGVLYASLMAGVGAGQTGFGMTHRLARLLEGETEAPYTVAAASMAAEMTDLQIQLLADRLPDDFAMDKYAMIGELLSGRPFNDREEAYASLVGTLRRWVVRLEVPKVSIEVGAFDRVMDMFINSWDKSVFPFPLDPEEMERALERRLLLGV